MALVQVLVQLLDLVWGQGLEWVWVLVSASVPALYQACNWALGQVLDHEWGLVLDQVWVWSGLVWGRSRGGWLKKPQLSDSGGGMEDFGASSRAAGCLVVRHRQITSGRAT